MKTMKKLMALALAAAMLLSLSACGGFEMSMSRAAVKMSRLESLHTDLDASLELSMPGLLGQSLSLELGARAGIDSRFHPLLSRAEIRVDTLGTAQDLLYYLEQAGDEAVVYLSSDGGRTWLKDAVTKEDLPGPIKLELKDLLVFRELAPSFTEAGTEEIQGSPALRYDGVIEGKFVSLALSMTGALDLLHDALGVEIKEEELGEMGGIPASIWIDKHSGMIVRFSMEPTEVLQSVVSAAVRQLLDSYGLGMVPAELTLDRAEICMDFSQFDAVPEIIIPAAAKL